MSQNIKQIFDAHPATTLASTDLFYLGRSPYGATSDFAAQWSTILGYIPLAVTTNVTGTSASLVANQIFLANNAGLVTLTLPATASVGALIQVVGVGAGGWKIAQSSGQQIVIGNTSSTSGAGGSVASSQARDAITIICITANTIFQSIAGVSAAYTIV